MIVSYNEFNEFNELNEGIQKRKNVMLKSLENYTNRSKEENILLDEKMYNELLDIAEDNKWKGTWKVIPNPKNTTQNIIKFVVA